MTNARRFNLGRSVRLSAASKSPAGVARKRATVSALNTSTPTPTQPDERPHDVPPKLEPLSPLSPFQSPLSPATETSPDLRSYAQLIPEQGPAPPYQLPEVPVSHSSSMSNIFNRVLDTDTSSSSLDVVFSTSDYSFDSSATCGTLPGTDDAATSASPRSGHLGRPSFSVLRIPDTMRSHSLLPWAAPSPTSCATFDPLHDLPLNKVVSFSPTVNDLKRMPLPPPTTRSDHGRPAEPALAGDAARPLDHHDGCAPGVATADNADFPPISPRALADEHAPSQAAASGPSTDLDLLDFGAILAAFGASLGVDSDAIVGSHSRPSSPRTSPRASPRSSPMRSAFAVPVPSPPSSPRARDNRQTDDVAGPSTATEVTSPLTPVFKLTEHDTHGAAAREKSVAFAEEESSELWWDASDWPSERDSIESDRTCVNPSAFAGAGVSSGMEEAKAELAPEPESDMESSSPISISESDSLHLGTILDLFPRPPTPTDGAPPLPIAAGAFALAMHPPQPPTLRVPVPSAPRLRAPVPRQGAHAKSGRGHPPRRRAMVMAEPVLESVAESLSQSEFAALITDVFGESFVGGWWDEVDVGA